MELNKKKIGSTKTVVELLEEYKTPTKEASIERKKRSIEDKKLIDAVNIDSSKDNITREK